MIRLAILSALLFAAAPAQARSLGERFAATASMIVGAGIVARNIKVCF